MIQVLEATGNPFETKIASFLRLQSDKALDEALAGALEEFDDYQNKQKE